MIDARGLCQRLTPCDQLALCKGASQHGMVSRPVRHGIPSRAAWYPAQTGIPFNVASCVSHEKSSWDPNRCGVPSKVKRGIPQDMDLCNGDSNLRVRASFSS